MLFHSVCGLRPAVRDAAGRLRTAGHRVWTPDLYDGRTAGSVTEGMELAGTIGREVLLRRAVAAAAPHADAGLVYAGLSLGAALAQTVALADGAARGLLMLHGTADLPEEARVRDGLPVQLHVAEPDPFETEDWLGAWYLRMRRAGAEAEIHRYRGAGHLYTDPELPDWDAEAAARTWAVALDFLADPDAAGG
ncbi:Dienelactone hydrolase [Streptomyces aidingensis]|uniref:Dienelactone hydrolase n=2 Tax=Streptomyces aidingensis TaxID=910347 RepID=A0A1I1LLD7_9ACTN|nr:Dienelactone hydrolase [Streptomyces aidingensis]